MEHRREILHNMFIRSFQGNVFYNMQIVLFISFYINPCLGEFVLGIESDTVQA